MLIQIHIPLSTFRSPPHPPLAVATHAMENLSGLWEAMRVDAGRRLRMKDVGSCQPGGGDAAVCFFSSLALRPPQINSRAHP